MIRVDASDHMLHLITSVIGSLNECCIFYAHAEYRSLWTNEREYRHLGTSWPGDFENFRTEFQGSGFYVD